MRFIDPSTYVSSWNDPQSGSLTITGANSTSVSGGYTIYTFTNLGTTNFTISGHGVADIMVVGGGGGGSALGGGGGAGGYIYRYNAVLTGASANTYVRVGAGGHGPTNNSHGPLGGAGQPTQLVVGGNTVAEAVGGGGGGGYSSTNADMQQTGSYYPSYTVNSSLVGNGLHLGAHTPLTLNPASPLPSQYGPGASGGRGGSGGGGGAHNSGTSNPGGSAVQGQGHPGGVGHHPNHYKGGGGGGAGSMGMDARPDWPGPNSHTAGWGGEGMANDISGQSVHYAGGGAGSNHHPVVHIGGGFGGGSISGAHSPNHGNLAPESGAIANTGGGGAGGESPESRGRGGTGVVIIRVNNAQSPTYVSSRQTGSSI